MLTSEFLYKTQRSSTITLMNPQQQTSEPSENRQDDRQDFHPGQTISPRNPGPAAAPAQNTPAPTLPAPVASPAPVPAQPEEPERSLYNPGTAAGDRTPEPQDQTPQFEEARPQPQNPGQVVSWTASEFIAHEKPLTWYLALGGIAFVVALVVYLISRDFLSTGVVVVAAVMLGVAAGRRPRELQYEVDLHGLSIGNKHHPYQNFRSFSLAQDGALRSINFMPLKRFAPPLAIYYDPADEERITEVLAAHLPLENHKHDAVDKLMKRIRF